MSWSSSVAVASGIVALVLTLVMTLPQTWMIWRDRSSTGVSAGTWALFFLSFSLWIGYDFRIDDSVNLVANVQAAASAGLLTVVIEGVTVGRTRRGALLLLGLVASGLLLMAFGRFGPMFILSVLLPAAALGRMPQVLRSLRTWRAVGASEVSVTTWWLGVGSGVAWIVHGALQPDVLIILTAVTSTVLSAAVLTFEYSARRARAVLAPA